MTLYKKKNINPDDPPWKVGVMKNPSSISDKTNNIVGDKELFRYNQLKDYTDLSDYEFEDKYVVSKHRWRYNNDPSYKRKIDADARITSKLYGTISPTIITDPNAQFMSPNQTTPELQQQVQNYHKDIIGNVLPIPLIDDIGKIKGITKIFKNPKSLFKSEIDWAKWNKEIPKNTQLMKEYTTIEQTSKANGTWMKNPDGSKFNGTPEQFIQQLSNNFKKAFPNGYKTAYRGEMAGDVHLTGDVGNNRTIFTADKKTGQHYAGSKGKLFELYHPESANNLSFNNNGRSWRNISRNHFGENPPKLDVLSGRLNTPQTGNYTSTDDIAKWIEDNNKDYVNINNIFDGTDAEFVRMVNHKKGNYLKSAIGNNGMFDMTNPNIFKSIIPGVVATGTGLYKAQQNKR